MDPLITLLAESLWFILPAYIANMLPVDVSQLPWLKKYRAPIDGGIMFYGNRLLGDSKTWRGFFVGVIGGTATGFIQTLFQAEAKKYFLNLPEMTVPLAFMLSLGALSGDIFASFLKRRVPMKPGDPAPILDQLDFVGGAFLFAWFWAMATSGEYSLEAFWNLLSVSQFWVIILFTPFVHMLGNGVAFLWKLKHKPW